MDAADLNAVLACVLWLLVFASGLLAMHRGRLPVPMAVMWLAFLSLATVNVISSIGSFIPSARVLDLRFWAAFFRGVTIVLLVGYVWHRWHE